MIIAKFAVVALFDLLGFTILSSTYLGERVSNQEFPRI